MIKIMSKSKTSHSNGTRPCKPFASIPVYGDLFQGTPERYREAIPVD